MRVAERPTEVSPRSSGHSTWATELSEIRRANVPVASCQLIDRHDPRANAAAAPA